MTYEFTSYKGIIYKGYIHPCIEHSKDEYKKLMYILMVWKFYHRQLRSEEKAIEITVLIKLSHFFSF